MSFAVTAYIREGIVMAADSRLTLTATSNQGGNVTNLMAISQSDSNQKVFVTKGGVGLSTVGDADINGIPIAGYIEQFVDQTVGMNTWDPSIVADEIIKYMNNQSKVPNTFFHIAGYDPTKGDQQVWYVDIQKKLKSRVNPVGNYGVAWAGEIDTISRILNPSAEIDVNTKQIKNVYPSHQIPFKYFTMQDAIDFALYAIRTTIDTIRFESRPKTVGGPIDILMIKPNEYKWIKRKEIHA